MNEGNGNGNGNGVGVGDAVLDRLRLVYPAAIPDAWDRFFADPGRPTPEELIRFCDGDSKVEAVLDGVAKFVLKAVPRGHVLLKHAVGHLEAARAEAAGERRRAEAAEARLAEAERRAAPSPPAAGPIRFGVRSTREERARNDDPRPLPDDLETWFLLGPYIDHVRLDPAERDGLCARPAYAEAIRFARECGVDCVPVQAAFGRAYTHTARRDLLAEMAREVAAVDDSTPPAPSGAYWLGHKLCQVRAARALGRPGTRMLLFGSALSAIEHALLRDSVELVRSRPAEYRLVEVDHVWAARAAAAG